MIRLDEWMCYEEITCLYVCVFMWKQETFQKNLHIFVNFFAGSDSFRVYFVTITCFGSFFLIFVGCL